MTSRIRHLVLWTQSDDKKASADEKARAAKPNSLSRSGSDSRTDSSSSTTDTSDCLLVRSPCLDFIPQGCSAVEEVSIRLWSQFGSDYCSRGVPLAPSGGCI